MFEHAALLSLPETIFKIYLDVGVAASSSVMHMITFEEVMLGTASALTIVVRHCAKVAGHHVTFNFA